MRVSRADGVTLMRLCRVWRGCSVGDGGLEGEVPATARRLRGARRGSAWRGRKRPSVRQERKLHPAHRAVGDLLPDLEEVPMRVAHEAPLALDVGMKSCQLRVLPLHGEVRDCPEDLAKEVHHGTDVEEDHLKGLLLEINDV